MMYFQIFQLVVLCLCIDGARSQRSYYMDKLSDCSRRTVNVDDNGVKIHGRSLSAPSNPPMECIIYLRSSYTRDDGSNKLEITVNTLNIRDCQITLNLYNGRNTVGSYLKAMSCGQKPSIIYSKTNEVTVKLSRPDTLLQTEYSFTLTVKPYKDRSVLESSNSNEKLTIGAIIGIVIGCLTIVAVLIVLCWCCCTGRISGFGDRFGGRTQKSGPGQDNRALEEKFRPPAVVLNDPNVWSTKTGGPDDRQFQPRYFQRGIPRHEMEMRGQGRGPPYNDRPPDYDRRQGEGRGYYANGPPDRGPGRDYEPYNDDRTAMKTSPQQQRKASPEQQRKASPQQQQRKETLIDDVFDSSSTINTDVDDATLQKRPLSDAGGNRSPKGKRKVPEEEDLDKSPQLERFKSTDLQSQPDTDTMRSPIHINAGVRASVEDDVGGSPVGSLRKNKKGSRSPKAKHKDGRQPDSMAMPPEAFEPIFTEPISGINYPSQQYQHPGYGQMAPQFQNAFMPYGMIPAGAFAPGVPGSQTYAYAYQTVPTGGAGAQPASQGAWVVQDTPTTEGNRRTAFAVEVSPDRKHRKNADPFGRTPYRDSGNSSKKGGRGRERGYAPDLSVVTRGAAPPDPGQGHRSVALKSGTDPDTGIHKVQAVWTDTVADPTDPEQGVDNPQITRKTITRVTTQSGYNELPPENDPLIALEAEPAFLSPSSRPVQAYSPAIMPAQPANNSNIDFYTGAGNSIPPPESSSTPVSTPRAPKYNGAIRDRIPLDDSTV